MQEAFGNAEDIRWVTMPVPQPMSRTWVAVLGSIGAWRTLSFIIFERKVAWVSSRMCSWKLGDGIGLASLLVSGVRAHVGVYLLVCKAVRCRVV
jgi:hypothetical protein